jgi:hypothetical protein
MRIVREEIDSSACLRVRVFVCIFVCVQPYSIALFGMPFALPTPQGRWTQRLKDISKTEIRGLR